MRRRYNTIGLSRRRLVFCSFDVLRAHFPLISLIRTHRYLSSYCISSDFCRFSTIHHVIYSIDVGTYNTVLIVIVWLHTWICLVYFRCILFFWQKSGEKAWRKLQRRLRDEEARTLRVSQLMGRPLHHGNATEWGSPGSSGGASESYASATQRRRTANDLSSPRNRP